jgi:hypothetical protein
LERTCDVSSRLSLELELPKMLSRESIPVKPERELDRLELTALIKPDVSESLSEAPDKALNMVLVVLLLIRY